MPAKPGENQNLSVKVENNRLVISIGVKTLAHAFEHSDYVFVIGENLKQAGKKEKVKVVDAQTFAKEVALCLIGEEEDGTTFVTAMLDEAMQDVFENGSEGAVEVET